jgi:hypothetical protein
MHGYGQARTVDLGEVDGAVEYQYGHGYGEYTDEYKVTPLPHVKILSLAVSRISEGLIYSVILPYINECIHRMGVPEEEVGVWSATAVSRFSSAPVKIRK